ncbi:MAG: choice-of-anchor J domain-containing protein, partial [Bacteroidia bacterium]
MEKIIYAFVLVFVIAASDAQTAFWTEDFGTGCSQGQVANGFNPSVNGVWTTSVTGTSGMYSNEWFISAAEAGMGVGNCGDGCLGTGPNNRTLHIGFNFFSPFIDQGASYLAGSASNTNKRAESPLINCTGRSNIILGFNFFLGGIVSSDYLEVMYSANGGATWSSLSTPSITPLGSCSPQGLWTSYTVALPASANNNANVKVGFRWQNTDPSGATLSVAIDDVQLLASAAAFTASFALTSPVCQTSSVTVTANTGTTVATGYTWTASPSGPVIAAPNASATGITFPSSGTYTISLTAASGTSAASYSNTITVNPSPTITITGTSGPICPPPTNIGNVTLTASGGVSYTWAPGPLMGTAININPAT